jgi:hypothetical protein
VKDFAETSFANGDFYYRQTDEDWYSIFIGNNAQTTEKPFLIANALFAGEATNDVHVPLGGDLYF